MSFDQALDKLSEKLNSRLLVQEEHGLQEGAQCALPLATVAQKMPGLDRVKGVRSEEKFEELAIDLHSNIAQRPEHAKYGQQDPTHGCQLLMEVCASSDPAIVALICVAKRAFIMFIA